MKASEIDAVIREVWRDVLWFSELRIGTGFGFDAERKMDMWGMKTTSPWHRVSVEIKVSRGDFRRDITNPMKQRRARLLSNQFYYAAPKGLLVPEDIPVWAGLLEVNPQADVTAMGWDRAKIVVPAPWFDTAAPTWRFVAVLARKAAAQGDAT